MLFATEGKSGAGLLTFEQFLIQRGIDPNQIAEVCCNMSAAFIAEIEEHFPAAQITVDKFHVMKLVNEAMDDIRREEQKEVVELKKTRYVWLKNKSNLIEGQKQTMLKMKDMNLQTGKAYRLKLALQDMWTYPTIYADLNFKQWIHWSVRSQVEPMTTGARFVTTICRRYFALVSV